MTNHEAYIFGWIFGRLNAEVYPDEIGGDFAEAAARPWSGNAKVISQAQTQGLLTMDIDHLIGEAMAEIRTTGPDMENGSEKYQPLEIQGSWQLGYFKGKSKSPLSEQQFDIEVARKNKKLTQSELAEAMGVDQAVISRWESGKVTPNAENMQKLKDILG